MHLCYKLCLVIQKVAVAGHLVIRAKYQPAGGHKHGAKNEHDQEAERTIDERRSYPQLEPANFVAVSFVAV